MATGDTEVMYRTLAAEKLKTEMGRKQEPIGLLQQKALSTFTGQMLYGHQTASSEAF